MALLKYGPIVSEARGKLNGVVLSRNQYGAYARAVGTLVDPETSWQQRQRANLITASQAWRALTQSDRTGWQAATHLHMRSNIFGDSFELSGHNLYVRTYLRALKIMVTPPSSVPANIPATSMVTVTFRRLNDFPTFALTPEPAEVPQTHTAVIEACNNISPGRLFVKNSWRYVCLITAGEQMTAEISDSVVSRLGPLIANKRAGARLYLIHNASLQASTPIHITSIILSA